MATSSILLRNAYDNLYKQLRRFIWSFDDVEKIADLEVISYTAFPDIDKLRKTFQSLRSSFREIEDDDFQEEVKSFQDFINKADKFYLKVDVPNEVLK